MNKDGLVNLYYTRIPNSRFVFRNGSAANFKGTEFTTTNESEIAELNEEIRTGHPTIFVLAGAERVDPRTLDPMEIFKAKVIREYLENLERASGNPNRDMGTTQQARLIPASTSSIAPVAAGGTGAQSNLPPVLVPPPKVPVNLGKALGLTEASDFTQVPLENANFSAPAPSEQQMARAVDPDVAAGLKALAVFNVPQTPPPPMFQVPPQE